MKFRRGMCLVAVVGSILLGSAGAWAQARPVYRKSSPIVAGHGHSCLLLSNGRVSCWGYNNKGQLGDGSHQNSFKPTLVSGLKHAVAVAAGGYHTCALKANGRYGAGATTTKGNWATGPEQGARHQ